jgi:chromosome segregation ATPase
LEDAKLEREDIEKKNSNNQKQVMEMSLKSKAELQLTNNKLADLSNDIDQLKRQYQDKERNYIMQKKTVEELNTKIQTQLAQITDKDQIIGEHEKRIYSLKKKTQELEKFKFVLDYKIKDLKTDIAPRGMAITRLKNETNEMDKNLRHYNKINANLGYIVDDLRIRQDHMVKLIKKNNNKIRMNENKIKDYKNRVYWVVQYIDDFDQLKNAVNQNLYKIVKDKEMKNVDIDPDIKKEYENQKRFLENSQNSLKRRLAREQEAHKQDNMNIMKENIKLIRMISNLRADVRRLNHEEKATSTKSKLKQQGKNL